RPSRAWASAMEATSDRARACMPPWAQNRVNAGLTVTRRLFPLEATRVYLKGMTVIPPSPTREEYDRDYAAALAANGDETIFQREEPIGLFIDWLADAKGTEP